MSSGNLTHPKEAPNTEKRQRVRRVRIGTTDPRLTPAAGIQVVREADRVLGVNAALDAGIGSVKERNRRLTGGELLLSLASEPHPGFKGG